MQPRSDLSTLGGCGAIALWSMTGAVARNASAVIGPIPAAAGVFLLSAAISAVVLIRQGGILQAARQCPLKYLLGCGTLFVIYEIALFLALGLAANHKQALEMTLINYLWPALTLLFSLVLLNKKAGLLLIPGTLLALIGEYLVIGTGGSLSFSSFSEHVGQNPVAYGCALLAALIWGLYSNLARRWGGQRGGVLLFIIATGIILGLLGLLFPSPNPLTVRTACELGMLAVSSIAAYALWDRAMRRGRMVLVAALSYFTPLFSTLVLCLYLHVTPGAELAAGCALLVAGSLLSWRSVRDAPHSKGNA